MVLDSILRVSSPDWVSIYHNPIRGMIEALGH